MSRSGEVMVLDDESMVCEHLQGPLTEKGYNVETFTDSQQALERLDAKRFDVVVTDLKMKGPTGLDVLVAVKERKLPTEVIIITGYATLEAVRGAEMVGVYEFLPKPFKMAELGSLIKKAAKKARRHSS